jgi:ubiquinone/menaquinone biosynthesis C-methylase UbiE
VITVDFLKLNLSPGSRVLDIGCGSGRHTAAALALPVALAAGMDTNRKDLLSAEDRLNLHHRLDMIRGGKWAFACADALRIPFRAGTFDAVICSEVLEHIHDHEDALAEALRVLRPGGTLVVSVPRWWPEKICWWLSKDYANTDGGHIRIYRTKELLELVTANRLKFTGKHYAHSLHSPYWWLKCLMGIENETAVPVRLYHRFLTWVMMKKPAAVCFLERLLNPLLGKSIVIYLRKNHTGERT